MITIICLPFILKAQHDQYQFSHLNVGNGLCNNQVTCIAKDSKGFMWFGTITGLNRYDGFKFTVFRHSITDSTSLNNDDIVSIVEGPEQKLWVKTKSGLNIYDPLTEKFCSVSAFIKNGDIPAAQISDIYKVSNTIYALVHPDLGIYLYNSVNKQAEHYYNRKNQKESISSDPVTVVVPGPVNCIWIAHTSGLLEQIDLTTKKVIYRKEVVSKPEEKQLNYTAYLDHENGLWIFTSGADHGIYFFDTKTLTLKHFDKESADGRLNSNVINSVTQDDAGLIWIATDHGGINLINKKDFKVRYLMNKENDDKSLTQNSIVSIYKDDLGIIWGGTFKKGIIYYHKDIIKFPLIRHLSSDAASLPFDDVNRFAEDAAGNLWIGTNGGGLIYFNRHTGVYKQYKHSASNGNSIGNDVIVSLFMDHEQKLWIGSYFGGLDCFDGRTFVHYKHNESDPSSLSDDRVWEILEDSAHQLWIGTLAGGLNRFDRNKNIFYHYRKADHHSIYSDYISSILEDKFGSIWVGTSGGISVIKRSGAIVHYTHSEKRSSGLIANSITNLFIDSRGWVWAATRVGVSILDPGTGKILNLRKEDGLPDNAVKDILEDEKHNMWLSTSNGLSKLIVTTANNQLSTHRFSNYDESDGLQGFEFNESASFKTSKGELVFGGANGFNIFNPDNITSADNRPDVVLTSLQLFTKNIAPGQKVNGHVILSQSIAETRQITLNYDENVFSIEFAALDFFNPDKINIQYILEKYDQSWLSTDNKTRKVTYTNLAPGTYVFKIRATNDKLTGKTTTLQIVITPPFWKTRVAYVIYFLLIGASLYLARRRGINRIKAEFAVEQERQQAHRLHELDMMKIKFFTNVSHEFRTPLSLILAPVNKIISQTENPDHVQQLQMINRNARRLLNMVNQLLDFRKIEEQELKLHCSNGDIISFIEEVAVSFTDIAEKKNISFVFDSDTDLFEMDFDHDKVERILFNLISNAFKFTREGGHVSVLLSLHKDAAKNTNVLEIKVIDTGIGIPADSQDKIFDRFFQNDVPIFMVNQGSGIGLAITKEFVKLHHGEISVESNLNEGSCFIVKLPFIAGSEDTCKTVVNLLRQSETPLSATDLAHGKKQTVLLIEDNDDFRFYLKDNLKDYFNVIEAVNGKEGWQKALALHPNLIVSDISMPEMNGMDLCNKLKNDSRTTHVPVVLLTALAGEEQQLKGLNTGASDYLTKPFNFEILLSKLKNILLQQELMRKTYTKQVEINPSEITIASPDELFVSKALQVIEQNIDNADFSVEELSSEMCMSRVTLYKKTLSLTGKSPVELIRTIRLKRAVQLLENGYLTISQVSYKVGFKSQKYFARSFKSEYNMLPSEYLAGKKAEAIK